MQKEYARYEDIDQNQLQIDIEQIKSEIGAPCQEDFEHLLKLERWGRALTFGGFYLMFVISALELTGHMTTLLFWVMATISAILMGIGNMSRWMNVAHPVLHGAYDKVPNVPEKYTKSGFAKGKRKYIDWLDWIRPEAWAYEHNIMHHYHLGEELDPDSVEINMQKITSLNMPIIFKYAFVYLMVFTWKFIYYAPNTLRILENKERRKQGLDDLDDIYYSPFKKNGLKLWTHYFLPYALVQFAFLPLLFLPLGLEAVFNAFIILVLAELVANAHSFFVILPSHSADDIYRFETPHKSQGEFYLRQIMGSVNYTTGTDRLDFMNGWLNYQLEHHLFPNIPLSQYQKMQPIVKELCAKYNLEYRQEGVFTRVNKTIELMVGKTTALRIEGI